MPARSALVSLEGPINAVPIPRPPDETPTLLHWLTWHLEGVRTTRTNTRNLYPARASLSSLWIYYICPMPAALTSRFAHCCQLVEYLRWLPAIPQPWTLARTHQLNVKPVNDASSIQKKKAYGKYLIYSISSTQLHTKYNLKNIINYTIHKWIFHLYIKLIFFATYVQ